MAKNDWDIAVVLGPNVGVMEVDTRRKRGACTQLMMYNNMESTGYRDCERDGVAGGRGRGSGRGTRSGADRDVQGEDCE